MSNNDWWVTPKRRLSDLPKEITLNVKIDVFNERVNGWQLDIADQLINGIKNEKGEIVIEGNPHAGYAVLDIMLSYFEMIAKYHDGYTGAIRNGKLHELSKPYFKKGVRMVFPEMEKEKDQDLVEEFLDKLYGEVRCGMYHTGNNSPRIFLEGGKHPAIGFYKSKKVVINPQQLVLELKRDFSNYINQLKDPNNLKLRQNFEKRFDKDTLPESK